MLYEIVNPSDPITFEAEDPKVATAVGILLGRGAFSVVGENDERVLPILLFASEEQTEQIIEDTFGDYEKWNSENRLAVAEALESVMVCEISDRRALNAEFEGLSRDEKVARLRRFNDEQRSSMNDIAGAAFSAAEQLRKTQEQRSRE
jgi:hypothetical protein